MLRGSLREFYHLRVRFVCCSYRFNLLDVGATFACNAAKGGRRKSSDLGSIMMTDEVQHASGRFGKVIICSGHMIDAPDRKIPRFPASKASAVRAEIARQLDYWNTAPNDLAICGGACGADILFAEECVRRGAQIRLLLAQKVEDFVRASVRHGGDDWVRRFDALRAQAQVEILPEKAATVPNDTSIYARTNLWIIETARVEARDPRRIYALLVWDEKPTGDGPGGTSDFQQKVCDLGASLEIINPTKLP
jgi:hypothetical protein